MNEPCTFVIFGVTGNLSRNKLLPALYHLEQAGRLHEGVRIIGFARREWDDETFRQKVAEHLSPRARNGLDKNVFDNFSRRLDYFQGDLDDTASYTRLASLLEQDKYHSNHIFYLAISPAEFGEVTAQLSVAGLNLEESGWSRVVIEKPFGYDLDSAQMLE